MISGIDLKKTVPFTLPDDKDDPTVWKLGFVPSYLLARMTQEVQGKEIEYAYKILQVTLKGWENFSVPFETKKENIFGREINVVPLELLEQIPLGAITELSARALEINQLNKDEEKNS